MIIIFDFNRTIYDPETDACVPGVGAVLAELFARGETLHLVSRREPGREGVLASLDVEHFFTSVSFLDEKETAIRRIIQAANETVYVVGDHLHDEIRIGNRLGARTVWLRRGKFAGLMPEMDEDVPWRTIEDIREVLRSIA